MRISVFGMGYVGAVSSACLARDGHSVIGVDPSMVKVDIINKGQSPIIESQLDQLISDAVKNGRLRATASADEAIAQTDISFVCVGTPSAANGSLDLRFVRSACKDIGEQLAEKSSFHTVVMRSTILPGTMRDVVIPALEEASGLVAGKDFGVCNNPEFLREGTAVKDYDNPPKTVIGAIDDRSADILAELYAKLDAPLIKTDIEVAELVKYIDNVWHALKVGFANEVGSLCKPHGIDSHAVMDIFCQDTKLNLSPYYLKPGFAFGGSCLPKDVRALNYEANRLDLTLPIVGSIMESNRLQVDRAIQMIMDQGREARVGILGFSFKAGTDDLRESPMVNVIEHLIGKGMDIKLYDRNVQLAKLIGANRDYILKHIPHIAKLMVESLDQVLSESDVIVIGNGDAEFKTVVERTRADQVIIDLVRISDQTSNAGAYHGIAW